MDMKRNKLIGLLSLCLLAATFASCEDWNETKIRTLSDDIEILQLQNDALLSAEAKKNSDRNQAVARAKEDYRDTVRNNADAVRDAKKDVKDTKTRLRREQAQAY